MLETFFCWRSVSWRTDWIMEWMLHVWSDAALRVIISMFHWAHSFSPVFRGYLISQLLWKTCFEVLKILKMCITYHYTCQVLGLVVFVSSHPIGLLYLSIRILLVAGFAVSLWNLWYLQLITTQTQC